MSNEDKKALLTLITQYGASEYCAGIEQYTDRFSAEWENRAEEIFNEISAKIRAL